MFPIIHSMLLSSVIHRLHLCDKQRQIKKHFVDWRFFPDFPNPQYRLDLSIYGMYVECSILYNLNHRKFVHIQLFSCLCSIIIFICTIQNTFYNIILSLIIMSNLHFRSVRKIWWIKLRYSKLNKNIIK